MKFSEREGFKKVQEDLQIGSMNSALRNSLWNALDIALWSSRSFQNTQHGYPQILQFGNWLWRHYFKEPIDTLPNRGGEIHKIIRAYFFKCKWYEVYDFIEFTIQYLNATEQFDLDLYSDDSDHRFRGKAPTDSD